MKFILRTVAALIVLGLVGYLGWLVYARLQDGDGQAPARRRGPAAAPVEVAPVQHGPIEHRRRFTGTLEADQHFVVAPKVGGRIEQIMVDLADMVERGQVVAQLDDAEFEQPVMQQGAELEVTQANLAEAESALEIANRELKRIEALRERGVTSESQYDAAHAQQLAKRAAVEVARAQVTRSVLRWKPPAFARVTRA